MRFDGIIMGFNGLTLGFTATMVEFVAMEFDGTIMGLNGLILGCGVATYNRIVSGFLCDLERIVMDSFYYSQAAPQSHQQRPL